MVGSRRGRQLARIALGGALLGFVLGVPAAEAGRTSPDLALTSVDTVVGSENLLVRLRGSLVTEDLVQLDYPLQLLLFEQTKHARYVRFEVPTGAVSGKTRELADGIEPEDAEELLSKGKPLRDARVAFIGAGAIDVTIPLGTLTGPCRAVAYVMYDGDALLSNVVPFDAGAAP